MFKLPKTKVFFGSKEESFKIQNLEEWCVVHFCKSFFDRCPSREPYLNNPILKLDKRELFVNITDSDNPEDFDLLTFNQILNWIAANSEFNPIFIHCDWGQSRSPSLAMLYASKCTTGFPNEFFRAIEMVKKVQPKYVFPSGITKFIKANWKRFDCGIN